MGDRSREDEGRQEGGGGDGLFLEKVLAAAGRAGVAHHEGCIHLGGSGLGPLGRLGVVVAGGRQSGTNITSAGKKARFGGTHLLNTSSFRSSSAPWP